MTKDNNFLAYLYLFLTVTFWAGNFVVGKLASFYEVPPFSLNFYRWFFAWLILAPFTIPEILEKRNYIIKNYKLFIVLGVLSSAFFKRRYVILDIHGKNICPSHKRSTWTMECAAF